MVLPSLGFVISIGLRYVEVDLFITSLMPHEYKREPVGPRLFTCWDKGCRRLVAYQVNVGGSSGLVANLAQVKRERVSCAIRLW